MPPQVVPTSLGKGWWRMIRSVGDILRGVHVMNGCRHSFWVPALSAMVAIFAAGPLSAQTTPAADGKTLPSFLGSDRLPDLMAARDAVIARHKAALAAREATKEAEIRLLAASDDVNRRAEAERVLAADIRLRAEALSIKFASELPAEAEPAKLTFITPAAPGTARAVTAQAQPAVVKAPAATAGTKPQQVVAAVETSAVDTATTLAMQRATDALTRANRDLEEINRRAAAAKAQSPAVKGAWTTAIHEIEEARREATDAVAQALRALDDKQRALLGSTVVAGSEPATAEATGSPEKKERMIPPYALGAGVR